MSKVYDVIKTLTMYAIPGLSTFYLTISSIWGLPYGDQIAKTIIATEGILAIVLAILNVLYNLKKEEK